MPEVKKALMAQPLGGSTGCLEHFTPSSVDIDSIKFRDKAREKQRQKVSWKEELTISCSAHSHEQETPFAVYNFNNLTLTLSYPSSPM
jgi:hypothetical protein